MTREEFLRSKGQNPTTITRSDTAAPSSAGTRAGETRNPNPSSSVHRGTSTGRGIGAARGSVSDDYLKSIGLSADRYSGGTGPEGFVGDQQKIFDHIKQDKSGGRNYNYLDLTALAEVGMLPGGPNDPRPPGPVPDRPGPGGSYRGGGGYGGPKNFKSFADQQMALINGRRRNKVAPMQDFGPAPEDLMSDKIRELGAAGRSNVDEVFGAIPEMSENSFRDYNPVQVQARDAQIAALLRAQGMGDGFAEAKQLQAEDDMALLNSFWSNYGGAMEANTDQSNARMNADRMTMAVNEKRQIESEEMIQLAAAAKAQQDKEEAYRQRQLAAEAAYAQQQTAADNARDNEVFQLAQQLLQYGLQADQDLSGYDVAGLLNGSY